MNQILVTEKLYITPELKRKKKMYKFNFVISIILIAILFSFYAYAEYDRNKNEEVSQDILASMNEANMASNGVIQIDNTTISSEDDVWIIALDGGKDNVPVVEEKIEPEVSIISTMLSDKYTAPNGKTYTIVGSVSIPKINVNYPILSETSDSLLKVSVCKFWGCDPNQVGNLCIAGHNYRNSRFFSKVPNLVVGDTIEITDLYNKTLTYSVYDKYTVDPADVSCTSQLTNGKKIVTLITCTNDSKQRVVVKAVEKE